MIAAVLVTDLDPAKTRALALPRIGGTVVGAGLGVVLLAFMPPGLGAVALGIFVAMLACQLCGMSDAAKLAGYVCALVVLEHSASPATYAFYRLTETLIGVAMAVVVSLVPKLLDSR